jgi:hypothetical protein
MLDFVVFLEHLPYGASMLQEKRASRGVLGSGIVIMAVGAAVFSIGWKLHLNPVAETAFVITLVGWIMVIVGFAFWVVSTLAAKFPRKTR